MILSSLARLYDRLLSDPEVEIAPRYWSREAVSYRLLVDADGTLRGIEPLSVETSGKRRPIALLVPEHENRTSGVKPFFLCDSAAYFIGADDQRGITKLDACTELHRSVLKDCKDVASQAVLAFFERSPQSLEGPLWQEFVNGGFAALYLLQEHRYAHECASIKQAWDNYSKSRDSSDEGVEGVCGITGSHGRLARLFPQISGFPISGANSSGVSLVSFNQDAFESYGKSQAYGASMSEEAAFKAGTALKFLVKDPNHRMRLGDTLVVFWSDRPARNEDSLLALILDAVGAGNASEEAEDRRTLQKLRGYLLGIQAGSVRVEGAPLDLDTRYFILGLSPNVARLAIRFFYTETLGAITNNFNQYLEDIAIVGLDRFSPRRLLQQTAQLGKEESIPATLINESFEAMLKGTAFPQMLFGTLLMRMRCDRASRNAWDMRERAALLKACLVRKHRLRARGCVQKEEITMALNEDNANVGYVLGRMFAYIERAQGLAQGDKLNATVRDKYIATAAATPSRVFPLLLNNFQNHLAKARKDPAKEGFARGIDVGMGRAASLISDEGSPIPKTLGADDQAAFYIGYYHQREAFFTKKDGISADGGEPESVEAK